MIDKHNDRLLNEYYDKQRKEELLDEQYSELVELFNEELQAFYEDFVLNNVPVELENDFKEGVSVNVSF